MSDQLFDHAVRDWLEDGSDRTPTTAIDAVLLAVKTTPQERDLRIPRRFTYMPFPMRLAAAVAVVAIIGVAGFALIRPSQDNGAAPSPTPTSAAPLVPTASAPGAAATDPPDAAADTNLDTKTWAAFTSTRYGYSAAYPAVSGWFVSVATQDWVFETREQFWSSDGEGADRFLSPGTFYHLTAVASTMPAQTTADQWIDSYINMGSACPPARNLPFIEIDGHQGRISTNCDIPEAFVTVGQTMFVFGIDDSDDVLLKAFLMTVKLPAA